MAVASYTKSGTKSPTAVPLDKKIFGVEVKNHELIKSAYLSYLAGGRINLAVAKKRGEVRGGGRKPIRQKGTGNARVGSTRTPLWRGGGIIFGPTGVENYSKKLNQQAKQKALRQALTLAAGSSKIIVIEDFIITSGKTADAARLLAKIQASGKVLLVVENKDPKLSRAIKNLKDLKVVQASYLNVYDSVSVDKLVVTKSALHALSQTLGGSK